jgi:homocitrate synthase
MADVRPLAIDDADSIIRSFHLSLSNGDPVQLVPNGEAAPILNGA